MARNPSASPELSRLDRILELVTDHERGYREQDMRLADVVQGMAGLECRLAAEIAPLTALKERDVPRELDLARTAIEAVVRQLTAVTQTNQALQAELASSHQRQAQQQAAHEAAMAALHADVGALRSRVDGACTRGAVEQLRVATQQQLEQQREELEAQLQSVQRELSSKQSQAADAATTQAAAAVRELEAWTKAELLGMAAQMKTVVQSCASHQQQVNTQMEALQQQWEAANAALEGVAQDSRRMKRHVARVQQQAEELQQAVPAASAAGARGSASGGGGHAALQQLHSELQQLAAAEQQLLARVDALCRSGQHAQDVQARVHELECLLAAHVSDMSHMAEAVAACLSAARGPLAAAAAAAAAAVPAPLPPLNSYLSSLLGPAAAASVAAPALAPPPAAASGCGRAADASTALWQAAWDEHLAHMDNLVARMRRQQQPRTHKQAPPGTSSLGDGQRGSAWHHLASLSPTKPQRLRAGLAAGAAPHADS